MTRAHAPSEPWTHPKAIDEIRRAAHRSALWGPRYPQRFADRLAQALRDIQAFPGAWPLHLAGTRRYALRDLPYYVVFRACDPLEVYALCHERSRPGAWL